MATELLEPPIETEFEPAMRLDETFNGVHMTSEEFDAIEDWDPAFQYELIRGIVIVSPIPSGAESDSVDALGQLLRNYQDQHPNGRALDLTLSERHVFLPDGSRRKADRLLWVGLGRMPNLMTDVPAIVVEFVSSSRRDHLRDYVHKREEYRSIGVKEYWVIDRFRSRMTTFRATGESVVARTETYHTDLLPGFELPLERLLGVADKWKNK